MDQEEREVLDGLRKAATRLHRLTTDASPEIERARARVDWWATRAARAPETEAR